MPPPNNPLTIAPSILAADPTRLQHEIRRLNHTTAQWIHWDIMDSHFVPNLTFGPHTIQQLRPHTKLHFDIHLMCSNPQPLIQPFLQAGANTITLHAELNPTTIQQLHQQTRAQQCQTGIALNPDTPLTALQPHLPHIDLLLIMTVQPGHGGQPFLQKTLPKIRAAAQQRQKNQHHYRIQVDGGINTKTAPQCTQAGADTLVAGTALYTQPNLQTAINQLRHAAQQPHNQTKTKTT